MASTVVALVMVPELFREERYGCIGWNIRGKRMILSGCARAAINKYRTKNAWGQLQLWRLKSSQAAARIMSSFPVNFYFLNCLRRSVVVQSVEALAIVLAAANRPFAATQKTRRKGLKIPYSKNESMYSGT